MKYELKRSKLMLIISGVLVIIGLLTGFFYEYSNGDILAVVFAILFVYELVRSKDKKFTFDETGFYIGDMRYSYSDIEQIESSRFRFTTYVRIIVNGSEVYKFDNRYKGAKEFVRQLTLNGVDHNLFG